MRSLKARKNKEVGNKCKARHELAANIEAGKGA